MTVQRMRARWIDMLSRRVQMGVVALRTEAVLLGTTSSPQAKQVKGIALLKSATSRSHLRRSWGGILRPVMARTVQRRRAPRAERIMAIQRGGKASPAM